jgi:dCTP deaminase
MRSKRTIASSQRGEPNAKRLRLSRARRRKRGERGVEPRERRKKQQAVAVPAFAKATAAGLSTNQTMSIKPDTWIKRMALDHKMIEPFVENQVRTGVISYGVSSYGYDVRVGDEFKVFTNVYNTVVDPKNFDSKSFVDIKAEVCIIPPNSFALASTVEYFRIPRDILTVCLGKSTYARCGIIVNVTPFEPEWEGHVTIEISNTTPLPAKIYANEGIAQVLFFQSDEPCAVSYKDKKGKYQAQRGVTLPKL